MRQKPAALQIPQLWCDSHAKTGNANARSSPRCNGVRTLTSVPGYNLTVNATTIHRDDFNEVNPTGPYTLTAQGLVQTDDRHVIGVHGTGLLPNTPHVKDTFVTNTASDRARTRIL
ncbi:hypothetical protein F4804DRAFT_353098 [Jackrogersella minutella]|nr:hypothetical protein F4804DRAFT_353098 [Jackrogersella minutella]